MKKLLAAGLLSLGLVGCATTSGLAPKVTTSGFDGSKEFLLMGIVLHVIKWFVL
ncbi:hypothetical protein [Acinetobacter baumannii]|uniref:hypothetical protein n=1 Tax=Acinetobacter baumannii TaxID=470 RepID=UPI001D17D60D|nr:hypothetical protein [Acinetobacter baumannii]